MNKKAKLLTYLDKNFINSTDNLLWGDYSDKGISKIDRSIKSYDEGRVYYKYIGLAKIDGEDIYFSFDYMESSWAEYDEFPQLEDIQIVEPKRLTKTEYVVVKDES